MPKRERTDGGHTLERELVKRPRQTREEEQEAPIVTTARDIHLLLAFHQDARELKLGIKKFKLFLQTIVYPRDGASANLNNLNLLGEYLEFQKPKEVEDEESVYIKDLIQSWAFASEKNDDSLFSATAAIIALLIKTISTKIDLKEHGIGICRTVLQQNTSKLLFKGLSGPKHKEHIISPCLRVLTEIASFDGGIMGRQLYNRRDHVFEPRVIARSLGLIGAAKDDSEETERKPSVRSNAIRYVLANLKFQSEGIKMDIIKQSNIISALLTGLSDDPAPIIAEVLSVIDLNILQDRNITWSSKSQLVNDRALRSLSALYRIEKPDEKISGSDKTILEIFHEFMLRICTSSDAGAIRYSSGLYPPNSDSTAYDDEEDNIEEEMDVGNEINELHTQVLKKVSVRNHALANFSQSLRPYANELERELLLAILHAAPELVADYWLKKENFTFEPKLTSTWIGYSAFIFSSIQLPIPQYFGARSGYALHPPPAAIVLESILPLPLNQKVLKKCLASSSSLIRFFATRILIIAVEKLQSIVSIYRQVDSDTPNKSWAQAIPILTSLFIRRCPGMKDIIDVFRKVPEDDLMQREAATRLLALCYEVIPQLALAEKLDISVALNVALQRADSIEPSKPEDRLRLLDLAHLVKIASHSTDISWWKRPEKLKLSAFLTTLLVQVKSADRAGSDLEKLLLSVVSGKGLLQASTKPPSLRALIQSLKESNSVKITEGTLQFIDDCLGRFVTRQIVYEDQLDSFIASNGLKRDSLKPVSVLVTTLLEQWPFVEKNRKDDVAAIASWLLRLLQGLLDCGEDEAFLSATLNAMEQASSDKKAKKILSVGLTKSKKPNITDQVDIKTTKNGETNNHVPFTEKTGDFDISTYSAPLEGQPPNFVRFKTGDVLALLESSSLTSLIFSLSSVDAPTRIQATSALQHFMIRLEASTDPDRDMIYLLLGELVETAQQHQRENTTPLPYVVSAFAVEALVVIRDPSHAMYPKVAAFLTVRPQWSPYKLVREFLACTILAEPSEDSDTGPWKESAWLLRWLNNGLRTPADCDILRQVGAWETIGGLGAHPGLGQSKATTESVALSSISARPQKAIRKLILDLLGRTIALGEASTLATRAGGLAWLNAWERLGWVDVKIAKGLRDAILAQGKDRVGKWSFGMLDPGV
jgi:nucleolar pre-ribosomal-associated protein 1